MATVEERIEKFDLALVQRGLGHGVSVRKMQKWGARKPGATRRAR